MRSVKLRNNVKKTARKVQQIFIFHLNIDFYKEEDIFVIWNRVYSDKCKLDFSDETIRILKKSA